MRKDCLNIVFALLLVLIQLTPAPVMACVEGLSWGMDLLSVERHLGVSLNPAYEEVVEVYMRLKILR